MKLFFHVCASYKFTLKMNVKKLFSFEIDIDLFKNPSPKDVIANVKIMDTLSEPV